MADDVDVGPVGLGQMQPIFEAVSKRYKIPVSLIRARGQTATQLEARQLSIWLTCKLTRLSMEEIGKVIGKGKTSIGLARARIDRLRSDEPFMAKMSEELLAELRQA